MADDEQPTSGKRIVVYHGGYGCETGCCGHWAAFVDADTEFSYGFPDSVTEEKFTFDHPWITSHVGGDDPLEWAKNLIREQWGDEHVVDLDWEHSVLSDD